MPGKIVAIDEENVRIAIVVIVNESAARPHGFRQPLFSECTVVVGEVDSSLRRDVTEVDLLSAARNGQTRQPQRNRDTEKS
jgi:hypothetical protein